MPARAFEGFGARKEAEKGGKGEGLGKEGYEGFVGGERSKKGGRVKEKKGPGEKEERAGEEDDDPEARWVKMAEAFHESTLKDA